MKNNWLLIGTLENWENSLRQPIPIWGLKEIHLNKFNFLELNDYIWIYVKSPVKGVIGLGMVTDKYIDRINLFWKDEIENNKVIWPLRFRFRILKIIPKELWIKDNIKINDFNLFWNSGFHQLDENLSTELFKRFELKHKINPKEIEYGPVIIKPSERKDITFNHRELQEQIAEIGKLQDYYSETEYPIELPGERKNIDVVWKREIDGVPTFTFEVELSSMLEKAVERLKFSYFKQNSKPRIIVPNDCIHKVNNILSVQEKNFRTQIRIYEIKKIQELYDLKIKLKNLEKELDL